MNNYLEPKIRIINGKKFKFYKSENNFKIMQIETGELYDDASDLETANFHYIETNIPIQQEVIQDDTNRI